MSGLGAGHQSSVESPSTSPHTPTRRHVRRSEGNLRESRLITEVCTLMELTPDSGVSCALMVVRRLMTESRSHGVLGGDD
ncbi:putative C19orf21 [Gossypium arboreum]|uniref:Putative C19orf21 n=1 Tax=Gossypium arboreum TaxID=29729 RepID=A0A0B0P0J6_GOSAR|nr:putative C19orf21 [Gossypium arboreum]